MYNKIEIIISQKINPHYNISLESHLLDTCASDSVIMYLWKNDSTVVIGKNQNAFKECDVSRLKKEGGHLARRLSGGGAVYHDIKNLNFTFVTHKDNYDLKKQMQVILHAANKLNLNAVQTGRNDIEIDGRKFSGNAFLSRGDYKFHHGTIMIDTDREKMSKFLTVSQAKMQSKGVESVKSRVVNLIELYPGLTTDAMEKLLCESFSEIYGLTPQVIQEKDLKVEEIKKFMQEKIATEEWILGSNPAFENVLEQRFSWGGVEVNYTSEKGLIKDIKIFSDALDADEIEKAELLLKGKKLTELEEIGKQESEIIKDILFMF